MPQLPKKITSQKPDFSPPGQNQFQLHEVVEFERCSLFDSSHAYGEGFYRIRCSCGWKSAASQDQRALVALFEVHQR